MSLDERDKSDPAKWCQHERGRDGQPKKIHASQEAAEEFDRSARDSFPGNDEMYAYPCPYDSSHWHLSGIRSSDAYPGRGAIRRESEKVGEKTLEDEIAATTRYLQSLQDKKEELARLAAERVALHVRMARNGHLNTVMLYISVSGQTIWLTPDQGRELLAKLPGALAFEGMKDEELQEEPPEAA